MTMYLVRYDPVKGDRRVYECVDLALRDFDSCWHPMNFYAGFWTLSTSASALWRDKPYSAKDIYDHLRPHLKKGDRLLILQLKPDYAYNIKRKGVKVWHDEHLRRNNGPREGLDWKFRRGSKKPNPIPANPEPS